MRQAQRGGDRLRRRRLPGAPGSRPQRCASSHSGACRREEVPAAYGARMQEDDPGFWKRHHADQHNASHGSMPPDARAVWDPKPGSQAKAAATPRPMHQVCPCDSIRIMARQDGWTRKFCSAR
jgi:hypothetical protein